MASMTLGRVACPIKCGHLAAHVKLKTDKGEKAAHPYIHCPDCGVQVHARNQSQGDKIRAMMRPEKMDTPPEEPKPLEKPQEAPKPVLAVKMPPAPQKPPVAPPGKPGAPFGINW